MELSIVSPVYGAEQIIEELVNQIVESVERLNCDFEIILVDDCGPDNSWSKIETVCSLNSRVKGVRLSRNFGQHYAISAGLEISKGNYVVVMDCDLQDDPRYIPDLLSRAQAGFDIVYTVKRQRKHSLFKNLTAYVFNKMFNWLVDNKNWNSDNRIGSYSILSRKVVLAYNSVNDYRRHYLMVLRWLGFKADYLEVEHKERFAGKSSYSIRKLLSHAIDGITSQSDKLLRLTVVLGIMLSGVSFIAGIYIIIRSFFFSYQTGWPSLFTLTLFVGGLIILSVGISGIYIGKIFEQTKNRPLFIIDKTLNL